MNNQRKEGIAGLDFVAYLIGSAIGGLIGATAMLLYMPFRAVYRRATQKNPESSEVAGVSTAVEQGDGCVTQGGSSRKERDAELKALYDPAVEKQWLDSAIHRVDLRGAYVRVVFYPYQGLVRRTLVLKTRRLQDVLGRRLQIPDVTVTGAGELQEVLRKTKEEAQAVIDAQKPPAKTVFRDKPTENPVLSSGFTASVPDNNDSHPPPNTQGRPAPKPRKKEVSYRGSLVRHGLEQRGTGEDSYRCYCLHIDDDGLGGVHQIWGTDLERAIKEANVREGDRIEVAQVGVTPTGGGRRKNVFAIQKLTYRTTGR